jgi:hypothetical protein
VSATVSGLMTFVFSLGSHLDCHPPRVSCKTMAKRGPADQ